MSSNSSAFAAPQLLRPTIFPISTSPRSICFFPTSLSRPSVRVAQACRPRMSASGTPPPSEDRTSPATEPTPTEKDVEEPKFSAWGIASFGIIFAIFLISIIATLSRDFIPGGMTGPA